MKNQNKIKKNSPWVVAFFLAPYLLIFFLFRFVPSIASVFISFTKWDIIGKPKFAGIDNFIRLFHDELFFKSMVNNFKFLLIALPCLVIFSLIIAVVLNQKIKGRNIVRSISVIPYVLIPSVVGIMWNWLYDNQNGLFNYLLRVMGKSRVLWLSTEKTALMSVAVVIIWSFLGYNMILFLAGLQGINTELYEASHIDGANQLQTFIKITLPLLKPTISLIITLTLINVVQIYDQVFVMTNGGPNHSTLTMIQYEFITGFEQRSMGYGSTVGVAVFTVLTVLIFIKNRFFQEESEV